MRRVLLCFPILLVLAACPNDQVSNLPNTPTCKDAVRNGTEGDVDCGGTCAAKCAVGATCARAEDCASNRCTTALRCGPALRVRRVLPPSGPVAGGSAVVIAGENFEPGTKVTFAGIDATDVAITASAITAKTPAAASPGLVAVEVVAPDGAKGTLSAGFSYYGSDAGTVDPGLERVLPATGPASGGTRGVVFGAGFVPGARVFFGDAAAPLVRVANTTGLVVSTPASGVGAADVMVVNPDGRAARLADAFTFTGNPGVPPKISGVTPVEAPAGSAVHATITGEGLVDGTLVFLADHPATEVKHASDTSLEVVFEGLAPGRYTVSVTTPEGRTTHLPAALRFVPATCADGATNGTETDEDCGGECGPCADGSVCRVDLDCTGGLCANGRCAKGDCAANPCVNGGHCLPAQGGFFCDCATGFTGRLCADAVDDCKPNHCVNGATCVDGTDGFTCDCPEGFSGPTCAVNDDDCAANPCANGAACRDGIARAFCTCPAGWAGFRCEVNVDECADRPCQNGATCKDAVGGFTCKCVAGFSGDRCEVDIDDCAAAPCVRGTCEDRVNAYVCTCPAGYAGLRCETDIDDCAAAPCLHEGVCEDGVNTFTCDCPEGWRGPTCNVPAMGVNLRWYAELSVLRPERTTGVNPWIQDDPATRYDESAYTPELESVLSQGEAARLRDVQDAALIGRLSPSESLQDVELFWEPLTVGSHALDGVGVKTPSLQTLIDRQIAAWDEVEQIQTATRALISAVPAASTTVAGTTAYATQPAIPAATTTDTIVADEIPTGAGPVTVEAVDEGTPDVEYDVTKHHVGAWRVTRHAETSFTRRSATTSARVVDAVVVALEGATGNLVGGSKTIVGYERSQIVNKVAAVLETDFRTKAVAGHTDWVAPPSMQVKWQLGGPIYDINCTNPHVTNTWYEGNCREIYYDCSTNVNGTVYFGTEFLFRAYGLTPAYQLNGKDTYNGGTPAYLSYNGSLTLWYLDSVVRNSLVVTLQPNADLGFSSFAAWQETEAWGP